MAAGAFIMGAVARYAFSYVRSGITAPAAVPYQGW